MGYTLYTYGLYKLKTKTKQTLAQVLVWGSSFQYKRFFSVEIIIP